MSRFVEPLVLTGARWVGLEPLTEEHAPEIGARAADGDPGRLWFTMAPSPDTAAQWVARMVSLQAHGGLTFVVRGFFNFTSRTAIERLGATARKVSRR